MAGDDAVERVTGLVERLGRLARARSFTDGLNPAQWETLRYLGRCNSFSNTPGAVARFLGTTKGTVSQTVTALERKGMIEKRRCPRQPRSVKLNLTERGQHMLTRDPLADFEAAAVALGREVHALAERLDAFVDELRVLDGGASFGTCASCRFLGRDAASAGHCRNFNVALTEDDRLGICVAHEPAPH